jgi:hypothetical protein
MIRWILLGMFSIGVPLLFPDIAFADNCSNPGDCWGTAAGGAATAGGAGGLTILRLLRDVWRRRPTPPELRIDVNIKIDLQTRQMQRKEIIDDIDTSDQMRRFVRDIGRSIRKSREERRSREFLERIGRGLSSKDRNED